MKVVEKRHRLFHWQPLKKTTNNALAIQARPGKPKTKRKRVWHVVSAFFRGHSLREIGYFLFYLAAALGMLSLAGFVIVLALEHLMMLVGVGIAVALGIAALCYLPLG